MIRSTVALSLIYFSLTLPMDKDPIQITSSVPQRKIVFLDLGPDTALDLSEVKKITPYTHETSETEVESYMAQLKNGKVVYLTHFHKGAYAGTTIGSIIEKDNKELEFKSKYVNFNGLKDLYLKQAQQ